MTGGLVCTELKSFTCETNHSLTCYWRRIGPKMEIFILQFFGRHPDKVEANEVYPPGFVFTKKYEPIVKCYPNYFDKSNEVYFVLETRLSAEVEGWETKTINFNVEVAE